MAAMPTSDLFRVVLLTICVLCERRLNVYSNPLSCSLTKDTLPNGILRLRGHHLEVDKVHTSVKDGTSVTYECWTPEYEMYVDGQPSSHPTSKRMVDQKVCKNGTMHGLDIECLPTRCDCTELYQSDKVAELTKEGLQIVVCDNLVESGDFVELQCATVNGGTLVGQRGIECHAGVWQPFLATCNSKRTCEIPETENAIFQHESRQVAAGQTLLHGDVAEVTCQLGFSPAYMSILQNEKLLMSCTDGQWSHKDVACVAVPLPTTCNCDRIFAMGLLRRNVKHGPCNGVVTHGHQVALECRYVGLVLKKDGVIACEHGAWIYPEHPDVRCIRTIRACTVPATENTLFHVNSAQVLAGQNVAHGSINEVKCAIGYLLTEESLVSSGTLSVKCDDGQWSHTEFSCVPAQCNCDNIASASMLPRSLKAGQCKGKVQHDHMVEVVCFHEELTLKKDGAIKCEFGKWIYPEDKDVRCDRRTRSCVVSDIEAAVLRVDSKVTAPGDSVEHGKVIEVTCEKGFLPADKSTIVNDKMLVVCHDGQWSHDDISCAPAPCKCEHLFSTSMQRRHLKAGQCNRQVNHAHRVQVECLHAESILNKEGFIGCRFGKWYYPEDREVHCDPTRGRRKCSIPAIENAVFRLESNRVFAGQSVNHGEVSEVTCKEGYLPSQLSVTGDEKLLISCDDSQWSHSDISCTPAQCNCEQIFSSSLLRRYLKAGLCAGRVNHGQNIEVACRYSDLVLVKKGTIKCEFGEWIYPEDKDVRCRQRTRSCTVPEVENGVFYVRSIRVFAGQSINHGQVSDITCEAGFLPAHKSITQGEKISISCDDGEWTRTELSCIPVQCDCQKIVSSWMLRRYLKINSQCTGLLNHGNRVEVACSHPASMLKEKGFVTCEKGVWKYPEDSDVRCIPRPCSVKPGQFLNAVLFSNGELMNVQETVEVSHGTKIRLECKNSGYEIYRDDVLFYQPGKERKHPEIMCLSGVLIGRKTECRPARCACSDLVKELEGRYLEPDDCEDFIQNGESAQVECMDGYENPNAPFNTMCALGKWIIPPQAKCAVKPTSDPNKGRCSVFPSEFPNAYLYQDGNVVPLQKAIAVPHSTRVGISCKSLQFELYLDDYPFGEPGDERSYAEMICLNGVLRGRNTECRPARCTCYELEEEVVRRNLILYDCSDYISNARSVRLECVEGYYANTRTPVRAECSSGRWDIYPPVTCERRRIITTTSTTTTASPGECSSEESKVCPIEPADESCTFRQKLNVVGFYQNYKINEPEIAFSNGDKLLFRCEDITTFKFTGSNNRTCVNGRWTNEEPRCTRLKHRSRSSAPVITYKTRDGQSSVAPDGTLLITKEATVVLSCHWFNVFGQPTWLTDNLHTVVDPPEWNSYKDTFTLKVTLLQEKQSARYTCTNPHGKSHTIAIKVKSSSEYPNESEEEIEEVKPTEGFPPVFGITDVTWTTVKPNPTDDYIPTVKPTLVIVKPTSVVPVIVKPTKATYTTCPFQILGPNVLRFYKGRIDEAFKKEFSIGDEVVYRCKEITNFNFIGSMKQICTSDGWTGATPTCTELQHRHRYSAPVIVYEIKNGEGYVSQDGTLLVTQGASLTFHCHWFRSRGTPKWTAENPYAVSKPPAWNTIGDSYDLELLNMEDFHSGWYTCTNPYKKPHTIRIKVTKSIEESE